MMERGLYVNEQRADYGFFTGALVYCLGNHRCSDFDRSDPQLELALRPHRYAGCPSHIQYADGKEVFLSYNVLRQLEEIKDWVDRKSVV